MPARLGELGVSMSMTCYPFDYLCGQSEAEKVVGIFGCSAGECNGRPLCVASQLASTSVRLGTTPGLGAVATLAASTPRLAILGRGPATDPSANIDGCAPTGG